MKIKNYKLIELKINIILINSDEIEAAKIKLDEKWNLVKRVPNTTSFHSFRNFSNYQIEVKKVFNSKHSNIVQCYSI